METSKKQNEGLWNSSYFWELLKTAGTLRIMDEKPDVKTSELRNRVSEHSGFGGNAVTGKH